MKALLLFAALSASAFTATAQAAETVKVYGIHLFFNETEFVDELTLTFKDDGTVSGKMHVPNDFDGDIIFTSLTADRLVFDLFVPKNAGRPEDLVFHYDMRFFNSGRAQATGFVTIKGQQDFVASLVAFERAK